MEKYCCPKCGAPLMHWQEFVSYRCYKIDMRSGSPGKNRTLLERSGKDEKETDCYGLKCTKCSFDYYGYLNMNNVRYPDLDALLESVDTIIRERIKEKNESWF